MLETVTINKTAIKARIRLAAKAAGKTKQGDLASVLGVGPSAVSKLFGEDSAALEEHLLTFADKERVSLDWLVFGLGSMSLDAKPETAEEAIRRAENAEQLYKEEAAKSAALALSERNLRAEIEALRAGAPSRQ